MNQPVSTVEMTELLKSMPAESELEGIIKDAADDGASDYCSWTMANRAAEAVGKRLQTVEQLPACDGAEALMHQAIRIWLSCPAEKRPSPQALGMRIAEIATTSVTSTDGKGGA